MDEPTPAQVILFANWLQACGFGREDWESDASKPKVKRNRLPDKRILFPWIFQQHCQRQPIIIHAVRKIRAEMRQNQMAVRRSNMNKGQFAAQDEQNAADRYAVFVASRKWWRILKSGSSPRSAAVVCVPNYEAMSSAEQRSATLFTGFESPAFTAIFRFVRLLTLAAESPISSPLPTIGIPRRGEA